MISDQKTYDNKSHSDTASDRCSSDLTFSVDVTEALNHRPSFQEEADQRSTVNDEISTMEITKTSTSKDALTCFILGFLLMQVLIEMF
jgi:hypothetical protein